MKTKYQKNFQPCPKCGKAKSTRSKTCCYCAGKGSGSKARRDFIEVVCLGCNSLFSVPRWRIKQGRGEFCSRECVNEYQKTLVGVKSPKWKGGTSSRFGSRSTAWKVMRLWALERAGNKCSNCNCPVKGFNAIPHHIKPYAQCKTHEEAFGPDNIIIVCRSCHGKIENLGRTTNHKGQYNSKGTGGQ